MRKRFRDSSDLQIGRPPRIMEKIPRHEAHFDGEPECVRDTVRIMIGGAPATCFCMVV
ncbi:MAG: hypothetical protein IKW76_00700 [Clostridia bacterium]|nr:hypothetical protein [Clostridia bacterium]